MSGCKKTDMLFGCLHERMQPVKPMRLTWACQPHPVSTQLGSAVKLDLGVSCQLVSTHAIASAHAVMQPTKHASHSDLYGSLIEDEWSRPTKHTLG
jgi:hypothetical protein